MTRHIYDTDHDRTDPFNTHSDTTTADDPDTPENCPYCTKWWKCLRHRDDNSGTDRGGENQWIIRTHRTRSTDTACMCTPTTPCAQHCRPRFP